MRRAEVRGATTCKELGARSYTVGCDDEQGRLRWGKEGREGGGVTKLRRWELQEQAQPRQDLSHGLSIHLPIPAGVSAGRHCWTKALGGEGEDSEQGAEGCEVQRCSDAAMMQRPGVDAHTSSTPAPSIPCCRVTRDRQTRSGKACSPFLSLSLVLAPTPTHTHNPHAPGIHQHRRTGLLVPGPPITTTPPARSASALGKADPLPPSL